MRDHALLDAIHGHPVDRTPVWFMRQAGRHLPEYQTLRQQHGLMDIVRTPKLAAEVALLPLARYPLDAAITFGDITIPLLAAGLDLEIVDGFGPRISNPVRKPEDVRRLQPFDGHPHLEPVLETIRILKSRLNVPLIGFAGAPFTLATYAIEGGPSKDHSQTRAFYHRHPEAWSDLMDLLAQGVTDFLLAQATAGADVVQLFDSWNGVLSPASYAHAVFGPTRDVFRELRAACVPTIHFGTGNPELLPSMAAAGGDCIGVDWRIGLDHARQLVGPACSLQGNLDPTALLGPVDRCLDQARDVLEAAAARPGHVFNLGHGVHPESKPEQVSRLVDFVHNWGSHAK